MEIKLSEAIKRYEQYRRVNRALSQSTLNTDRWVLAAFLRQTGDIFVHNITIGHAEEYLASSTERGVGAGAYNNEIAKLKSFFNFCRMRKYMPRSSDPLVEVVRRKTVPRDSNRVPVREFPALLDAAINPRNRGILATALYLLSRSGEIKSLDVSDLDLANSTMRVTVHKSGGFVDYMPISLELDRELRQWMTYYTETMGQVPEPDWPLFPGQHYKHLTKGLHGAYTEGDGEFHLDPNFRAGKLNLISQRSLTAIGFPIRTSGGASLNEGMHTLRRSGARALFDSLVDKSYDGAIRLVQSMLHHRNMQTTEIYLGLNMEKHKRDDLLKGAVMYATPEPSNVVPMLREVSNG